MSEYYYENYEGEDDDNEYHENLQYAENHLRNEFTHEKPEFYKSAARKVVAEREKTGETFAQIINRLYR